jgi:hypothetical protein
MSRLALAMDEFFTWLESLPRDEALRMIREMPPSAGNLDEQLSAATVDAYRVAELLVGDNSDPAGDAPGWARLGGFDAIATWLQGDSRTCMHDPNLFRPTPVFAAAWRPELIVCGACMHLLRPPNPTADATCDGCGYICSGVDADDPIFPSTFVVGPLNFVMGLCGRCFADSRNQTGKKESA